MKSLVHALAIVAFAFASSPVSAATFLGNTIEARAGFPNGPAGTPGNSHEAGPIQSVVGAGVEFTNGQFDPFNGPSFDFDSTTIRITHIFASANHHADGTFNGYSFFDLFSAIDPILGVSITSDNTGYFSGDPSRIFFDANTIFINFEGLGPFAANTEINLSVDFGSEVPIPAALPLFLSGLGALTLVARRRKRQPA